MDIAGLRQEAAAIRRNLDELAADMAVGIISKSQMRAANERAGQVLDGIEAKLAEAAREDILAPMAGAANAAKVWDSLDLPRKRGVISALMTITLRSPGKGARRAFDPSTIGITWKREAPGAAAALENRLAAVSEPRRSPFSECRDQVCCGASFPLVIHTEHAGLDLCGPGSHLCEQSFGPRCRSRPTHRPQIHTGQVGGAQVGTSEVSFAEILIEAFGEAEGAVAGAGEVAGERAGDFAGDFAGEVAGAVAA